MFRKRKTLSQPSPQCREGSVFLHEVERGRGRGFKARGDFPIWLCVAAYLLTTSAFCWLGHHLVPGFPLWILIVFGFLWTPLQSYISARLIGITGSGLSVPYLKESAFILSGYRGLDIWFAPMQTGDFGSAAQRFRELELTRTRFTSVLKAEALILPVSLITSFLFWWGFWKMNQIPSDSFPFISRTWPVQARQAYLILTANSGEHSLLLDALKPDLIAGGAIVGFLAYGGVWLLGLPATVFYGLVGGTAMPLHMGLLLMGGALLGRYVFKKKFGEERWTRMVPVVTAGFACGMGLAGMLAVGAAILSYCTKSLPF
ncbi:MAG: hypothetical protein H6752_18570 [Candidatus Omnitrophica bacterium]|nr:hypothetical protein [Candidatus Omnitrophota bacterium]